MIIETTITETKYYFSVPCTHLFASLAWKWSEFRVGNWPRVNICMSKKIRNCLTWNLGYSAIVCPDQPENLQTVYGNFLKTVYQIFKPYQKHKSTFFKQCWRISSTRIALSIKRRLRSVHRLKPKMLTDFSTYFLHLFGPKLSIANKNFWNCL